jgi:toxin ParE1/3/4
VSARSSAGKDLFHPHAAAEYVEEIERLEADEREVAADFADAVDRATDRVIEYPEIGVVVLDRRGRRIRKWRVQGFRYSLIYALLDDRVRILAVAHHSRRPGYWRYRLRTL